MALLSLFAAADGSVIVHSYILPHQNVGSVIGMLGRCRSSSRNLKISAEPRQTWDRVFQPPVPFFSVPGSQVYLQIMGDPNRPLTPDHTSFAGRRVAPISETGEEAVTA